MRSKGRNKGRFVSLSGLKKISGPPEGRYPLMIIDKSGIPVFHLCEWYRRKRQYDIGRTPETYLDMLLPWIGFQMRFGYAWNDEPDHVRTQLVEFLRTDIGCQVGPAQEGDGYLVETTGNSPLSKSSLGVLLAAITSLYDVMIDASYYSHSNPMRSEYLTNLKRDHINQIKNSGAPDHAGIRSETWQKTHQDYPTKFFRQKRGKVWEPSIVMEPDEAQQRMHEVIDFMIQHATFLRDKVILLLLRQTGARLSEIVEMTVGGYQRVPHPERALVKNKGSRGREEKTVYFTPVIEEQLIKYIRTERAKHDLLGRKRIEDLEDHDPIFLTERGTSYDREAFYYHWNKLFETAQRQLKEQDKVEFSPHDIRHLRVTRAIKKIKEQAGENKALEDELIDGFWRLMGWRSPKTMETYTHVFNQRKALIEIMLTEDGNELTPQSSKDDEKKAFAKYQQSGKGMGESAPVTFSNDDDEFSWYEE
jgi:site-specific recombinase XerD